MKTRKLSNYWKSNKKAIFANWRQCEFIREKNNFSIISYIQSIRDHIENDLKLEIDIAIGVIEREIYSKI